MNHKILHIIDNREALDKKEMANSREAQIDVHKKVMQESMFTYITNVTKAHPPCHMFNPRILRMIKENSDKSLARCYKHKVIYLMGSHNSVCDTSHRP